MSFKFHNWPIYQELRQFRKDLLKEVVFQIPKEERFEIVSQLKRALNSSILNVAEGAYRKSDRDLAHFLNQADTSLNEVVACLDLCLDDRYIDQTTHKKFVERAEKLIAQLSGFRKHLQKNSK